MEGSITDWTPGERLIGILLSLRRQSEEELIEVIGAWEYPGSDWLTPEAEAKRSEERWSAGRKRIYAIREQV